MSQLATQTLFYFADLGQNKLGQPVAQTEGNYRCYLQILGCQLLFWWFGKSKWADLPETGFRKRQGNYNCPLLLSGCHLRFCWFGTIKWANVLNKQKATTAAIC